MLDRIRWLWRLWAVWDAAEDNAKEEGVNPKSILTSRLFWLGLAEGVTGLLESTGVLTMLPDPWGGPALSLLGAVTIWLRTQTTRPVKFALPGKL